MSKKSKAKAARKEEAIANAKAQGTYKGGKKKYGWRGHSVSLPHSVFMDELDQFVNGIQLKADDFEPTVEQSGEKAQAEFVHIGYTTPDSIKVEAHPVVDLTEAPELQVIQLPNTREGRIAYAKAADGAGESKEFIATALGVSVKTVAGYLK